MGSIKSETDNQYKARILMGVAVVLRAAADAGVTVTIDETAAVIPGATAADVRNALDTLGRIGVVKKISAENIIT
jgi:hypothetical protein